MKLNPMINRIIESLPGIVNLLALAMFVIFFSAFTSNTTNIPNILAWSFDGLAELGKSRLGLLACESTHTSPAYSAFLGGLWLFATSALFLQFLGNQSPEHATICALTAYGLGFASFVALNGILFQFPQDASVGDYLQMAITRPNEAVDEEDLPRLAFVPFQLPLGCALLMLCLPATRKLPGAVPTLVCSAPLAIIPFILSNYFSSHLMCFGNPDVYTRVLNIASPFLLLFPITIYVGCLRMRPR